MEDHDWEGAALRVPTVDGIFYPAEPEALRARIAALLAEARPGALPAVYGLITPHAALDYAGAVAAAAYQSVSLRRPEVAVLLGPIHRNADEVVVVPQSSSFRTPLGDVPVERAILDELIAGPQSRSCFRVDDIPHLEEHCLEVQLPFLQHLFPSLKIVPLLVGQPSVALVQQLGLRLWETFSGRLARTLFVATANLAGAPGSRDAEACRARLLQHVVDADWKAITEEGVRRRACTCGVGAIAAILHLHRRRGGPVTVLRQGCSGDVPAGPRNTVHYAAIALAE